MLDLIEEAYYYFHSLMYCLLLLYHHHHLIIISYDVLLSIPLRRVLATVVELLRVLDVCLPSTAERHPTLDCARFAAWKRKARSIQSKACL